MHLVDHRELFEPCAALSEKKLPEVESRGRQMPVRAVGHAPMAFKRKALHVERLEQAGSYFGLNRLRRKKADAHACHNRLFDRFGAADLHEAWRRLVVAERIVGSAAGVRAVFPYDQAFVRDPHIRDVPFVSKRMRRGGNEHKGIRCERLGHDGRIIGRVNHHGEIDLVASQQGDELVTTAHRHVEFDAVLVIQECTDQVRKEIAARGNEPDPQALGAAGLEVVHRQFSSFQVCKNHHAMAQHDLARLGQGDPLARLREQRQASVVLQLLDLHRYGGLGQVQIFSRTGKTQIARNAFENL